MPSAQIGDAFSVTQSEALRLRRGQLTEQEARLPASSMVPAGSVKATHKHVQAKSEVDTDTRYNEGEGQDAAAMAGVMAAFSGLLQDPQLAEIIKNPEAAQTKAAAMDMRQLSPEQAATLGLTRPGWWRDDKTQTIESVKKNKQLERMHKPVIDIREKQLKRKGSHDSMDDPKQVPLDADARQYPELDAVFRTQEQHPEP